MTPLGPKRGRPASHRRTYSTGCGAVYPIGARLSLWFVGDDGKAAKLNGRVTRHGSFCATRNVGAVSDGYLTKRAALASVAIVEDEAVTA